MPRPRKTSRKPAEPALIIRDAHNFNAKIATHEVLEYGFALVDDISGKLIDVSRDELLDELGHDGDFIDLRTDRLDTTWDPVFIFRNHSRV